MPRRPARRWYSGTSWSNTSRSDGRVQHPDRLLEVQPQPHLLDLGGDDLAAAQQDRPGDLVVHQGLRRAQDPLVLALGEHDALGIARGGLEHRAHQVAGAEDEPLQIALIGLEIRDRPAGDAAFDGRARDGGRDLQDQARIERLRNDVVRAEHRRGAAVGRGDHFAGLDPRQLGDRLDRGDLHRLVDRGGPDIQRASEDERESTGRC